MSVYVTGDTHLPIDISKLNMKNFPIQKELTKDDYVIICGDFGGVWSKDQWAQDWKEECYWLDWLDTRNFTTLFVDGNHENFDRLNALPIEQWNGGLIHRVRPSIIHLMRGQVFTIDGERFFTMGGASSHDRGPTYINSKPWWSEELPSMDEYDQAFKNLDACGWNVDYVLTHCAPDTIQNILASWYQHDKLTNFLETLLPDLQFRNWYLGHYHCDKQIGDKFTCLYNKVIPLGCGLLQILKIV